jgi:hypothetical protein
VRMDPVRSMEHDGIPPRTELFSLEPIGPGTPFVEGLTGYIYRLASRHVLPVTDFLDVDRLMRFQRTDVDRRVRRRLFHASCYLLDGHEIETNRWIEALEAATGRIGLRSLTILPYVGFSADSWLRAWKAWCPQCYSVWRDKCLPTYEPLLWSIKAVSICPIHHAPLVGSNLSRAALLSAIAGIAWFGWERPRAMARVQRTSTKQMLCSCGQHSRSALYWLRCHNSQHN